MKILRLTLVVACCALLGACANQSVLSAKQQRIAKQVHATSNRFLTLRNGKTTQAMVKQAFGKPSKVVLDSKGKVKSVVYNKLAKVYGKRTFVPARVIGTSSELLGVQQQPTLVKVEINFNQDGTVTGFDMQKLSN